MHRLSKFIYQRLLGWKVTGFNNFDSLQKAVLIAAPHTSWHDFYVGVLLRSLLKIKVYFIAKSALFHPLIGWFFKSLGGTPVRRNANEKQVDAIARMFENKDKFRILLAPEGTRKKVSTWKTGFYFIAKKAKVPIVMLSFDFENKENKFSKPFYPTDNMEADFKFMRAFFEGVKGKIPEFS